jgi:hypothetical protein
MKKIVLELHRAEAMALAQLCKRFTFDDAERFANRHDGGREREAILDGFDPTDGVSRSGVRPAMTLRARLSRALALIRCVLLHRRHWVARHVGLMDCEVTCRECGRTRMAN